MMNHSMKNQCKVPPGTAIEGKWHKNRYTILKELGYGANGIVYLAQWNNQHVALKMSDNGMSIMSEVNVLKSFAKVQGSALGPSLLEVDDWVNNSGRLSFYTMEYIQGVDLLTFIEQNSHAWIPVLILQLLTELEKLHQNGWIFGDLKPENLIVTSSPVRIRCIDVGGTTIKGRAIKEFTEFYDRGYWGLGSRKADPGYDLFAVAMIMINTAYPNRFNKTKGGISQLSSMIKQKTSLHRFEEVMLRALEGKYTTTEQMREDLLLVMSKEQHMTVCQTRTGNLHNRQAKQKKHKKSGMMETVIIFMIIMSFYIVYILNQLL